MPFQLREGLLWVKASFPQSAEPLNFLLDTGAGASVINRGTADSATAGTASLPTDYLAVDLSKLSSSCQRAVDGLLGTDFFRGRAVQIDFQAQKVRVLRPDQVPASGEILPLQMRPCGIRIPITVNGHKRQWVRLDTGCASPLQWVTSLVRPQECKPQVAIGLAEVSIPQTPACSATASSPASPASQLTPNPAA